VVSADAGEVLRRPADLRLFGMAAGMWGSSLLALYANAVAATWIAVAAGAGAVGLALALFGRPVPARRVAIGWAAAAVLLGVVCGAASTGARTVSRDADPLADLARRHALVRAELTVTDDPKALGQARPGPATFLVPARLTRLVVDGLGAVSLDARVVVFATDPAWRTLLPSQAVATTGRLAPARGGDLTAASLTTTDAPEPVNRPSWMQRAAARLRAGLQAACAPLSTDPGGLLPGLVIGDTSRLDPALAEDFRTTGLTHLVAVSGANLAIVLSVILFAARWCRAGPWLATAICAAALVGFVVLARPSPSVVRAAAMGAVGLLALASGRRGAAAPALATAVIVALLIDPALAVDVGFALSVSATGALVLLARPWRDGLRARGVPAGLADALAVPAAAQVACGPIIVALSGGVSLVAVPANLLAAPAVAPATLLGVASAIVSPLWPDGAGFLAWVASWPARWLVAIARTGAAVPIGTVPWPAGLPGALALALVTAAVLVAARRPVCGASWSSSSSVSRWEPPRCVGPRRAGHRRARSLSRAMWVRAMRSCSRWVKPRRSWSTPVRSPWRWMAACAGWAWTPCPSSCSVTSTSTTSEACRACSGAGRSARCWCPRSGSPPRRTVPCAPRPRPRRCRWWWPRSAGPTPGAMTNCG
jgi:competence protein ComEC